MVFSPVQTFVFAPITRNKPCFLSGKGTSKFFNFPHVTPFFCQFRDETFYFLQFPEYTIFSSLFAKQSFFFKKNPTIAPPTYHLVGPCRLLLLRTSSKCRGHCVPHTSASGTISTRAAEIADHNHQAKRVRTVPQSFAVVSGDHRYCYSLICISRSLPLPLSWINPTALSNDGDLLRTASILNLVSGVHS